MTNKVESVKTCESCKIIIGGSKNKDSKYCSSSCRAKAFREEKKSQSVRQSVRSDSQSVRKENESVANEQSVRSDSQSVRKENESVANEQSVRSDETNIKTMPTASAQDLYDAIGSYKGGDWIDCPEKKELDKRLRDYPIKKLREEGYFIPNWKLNESK